MFAKLKGGSMMKKFLPNGHTNIRQKSNPVQDNIRYERTQSM